MRPARRDSSCTGVFADPVIGLAGSHPYDKEYNLRITLGVGGKDFNNQELTLPDVASLKIDYIRVYNLEDEMYLEDENISRVTPTTESPKEFEQGLLSPWG